MNNLFDSLTDKEKLLFRYVEDETEQGKTQLNQSYDQIGKALSISGATVHRAIQKLRKLGVIGIVPSTSKYENNKVIFYGFVDETKQIDDILKLASSLHLGTERFQNILNGKDEEIGLLRKENSDLYDQIEHWQEQVKLLTQAAKFDPEKIISSQSLGDGTIAYLIKE